MRWGVRTSSRKSKIGLGTSAHISLCGGGTRPSLELGGSRLASDRMILDDSFHLFESFKNIRHVEIGITICKL